MASNSEKKEGAVDITKIYEIIRGKAFIQDLWVDVMSDLRQKSSYMHLKNMVQKVIETSVDNYPINPKDHVEKLKTRTTFTDLGIMGYTIDTIISDVVKKKLKNELMTMISGVVEDHSHKLNSSNIENKTKSVIMLEDIGTLLCNGKTDDENEKTIGTTDFPGRSKRRSIENASSNQSPAKKRNEQKTTEKESRNGIPSVSCNSKDPKSGSPSKKLDYKGKKFDVTCGDENAEVDVVKVSDDDDDTHSIRSVSSVHTSDLSSFDDDISLSSEDENGVKIKKRVSLQLAQDLYSSGRLSDLRKIHRTEEQVSSGSSEKQLAAGSPSQRSSTRARKVNSRYISNDVVCPMKLILNQSDVSDREERLSTYYSETGQSCSSSTAVKQEKYSKQLNNWRDKRNCSHNSDSSSSSSDSDSSLPSLSSLNEVLSVAKRGRPRKDNSLADQASSPAKPASQKKRGRPSKGSNEKPQSSKKQCVLDNLLPNLEKKLELQNSEPEQSELDNSQSNEKNNDPEVKRKRGRPSSKSSLKEAVNEGSNQESVDSFSKLEESLCLKNTLPSSPSKSTKSYDSSDLYKPRSDFRIFNSSKGSRALTLFSN